MDVGIIGRGVAECGGLISHTLSLIHTHTFWVDLNFSLRINIYATRSSRSFAVRARFPHFFQQERPKSEGCGTVTKKWICSTLDIVRCMVEVVEMMTITTIKGI